MVSEKIIRKLTDYVLLNAYSVDSTGLYNGKSGISLCLFEVAKYLEDEYYEDHAFELLQESLLSKNEDIGFENGLSGIGYVLLYLIENKFVEADFDELFSTQHLIILNKLDSIEEPEDLLEFLKVIYYLVLVDKCKSDKSIHRLISKIIKAAEDYLLSQFSNFNLINYKKSKPRVLELFEHYLQVITFSDYSSLSDSLIKSYCELYQTGRVESRIKIGFYLKSLSMKFPEENIITVSEINIDNGIKNYYAQTRSLREKIEFISVLDYHNDRLKTNLVTNYFFGKTELELEKILIDSIPRMVLYSGYGDGISRFLLLLIKNNSLFNNFQLNQLL